MNNNSKPQNQYCKVPFKSIENYNEESQLRTSFASLTDFNQKVQLANFQDGQFFVIRSKNRDDVHKAIKYGIWTSSYHNNKKFRGAYMNGPVYFIFTTLKTNKFVGIARLIDKPDLETEFPYWGEIGKWKGVMKIRWIFVRDVSFDDLTDLEE